MHQQKSPWFVSKGDTEVDQIFYHDCIPKRGWLGKRNIYILAILSLKILYVPNRQNNVTYQM